MQQTVIDVLQRAKCSKSVQSSETKNTVDGEIFASTMRHKLEDDQDHTSKFASKRLIDDEEVVPDFPFVTSHVPDSNLNMMTGIESGYELVSAPSGQNEMMSGVPHNSSNLRPAEDDQISRLFLLERNSNDIALTQMSANQNPASSVDFGVVKHGEKQDFLKSEQEESSTENDLEHTDERLSQTIIKPQMIKTNSVVYKETKEEISSQSDSMMRIVQQASFDFDITENQTIQGKLQSGVNERLSAVSLPDHDLRNVSNDGIGALHVSPVSREINIESINGMPAAVSELGLEPEAVRIPDQVIASLILINRSQHHEMHVRLYPDHFGVMQINIINDNEGLSARIIADTLTTYQLMELNLSQLQQALNERQIDCNKVEVLYQPQSEQGFDQTMKGDNLFDQTDQHKGTRSSQFQLVTRSDDREDLELEALSARYRLSNHSFDHLA